MSPVRFLLGITFLCQFSLEGTNYGIQSWSLEEGLPSSQVIAIDQAADGRLWVATSRGLAVFDGHEFEVFNHVSVPELGTSDLSAMVISPHGDVWFADRSGKLGFFDGSDFHSVEGLPIEGGDYIIRLVVNNEGRVVGATSDATVLQLFPGKPMVVRKRRQWFEPSRDDSPGIQVFFDHEGQLFAGIHTELNRWTPSGVSRVLPELNVDTSENRAWLWALGTSPKGGVWIAADQKIRRFDDGAWVEDLGGFPFGVDAKLTAVVETREGMLWLASRGGGIRGLSRTDAPIVIAKNDGLPSVDINTLFEDRESNLWLGTDGGGLVRVRKNSFARFGAESILDDARVNSIVEDATHDLWIATEGHGLLHWNGYEFRSVFDRDKQTINVLLQDFRNRIWAGTQGKGLLVVYPPKEGLLERDVEIIEAFLDKSIVSLFEDSGKNIWVATEHSIVFIRDGNLAGEPTMPIPFSGRARCIIEDGDGDLWLGTMGRGVYRWKEGSLTQFTTQHGLPDNAVSSMCLDDQGGLWVGTYGGGIARFSGEFFTSFPGGPSGGDGFISGMVNDQQGALWLGTSRGISRIAWAGLNGASIADSRRQRNFGKGDGLAYLECSDRYHSGILLSDLGRLYFPMKRGVAELAMPELEPSPTWVPPVSIRDVIVDESPLLIVDDSGISMVNVGPGARRIEVKFSGVGLSAPERVVYRYRIAGNGSEWISLGNVRSVSFLELEAGDYHFEVSSALQSGNWNSDPAALLIRVAPNWWETTLAVWLAGSAGVLAIVALVSNIARRRIRVERAKRAMDQALSRERERIAQDMHDDLGARLTQLSFQGELAKRSIGQTTELESRLETVVESVRQTAQALDDVVWMTNPRNDNLERLISHLAQLACDMSESVGWELDLVIPESVHSCTVAGKNRHEIVMVVKELLNNASKHSGCSRVRFEILVEETELSIFISDDGCGFDLEACQLKGNGLRQMKQRVESARGTLTIRSNAGQGAVAEMVFRLDVIGEQ